MMVRACRTPCCRLKDKEPGKPPKSSELESGTAGVSQKETKKERRGEENTVTQPPGGKSSRSRPEAFTADNTHSCTAQLYAVHLRARRAKKTELGPLGDDVSPVFHLHLSNPHACHCENFDGQKVHGRKILEAVHARHRFSITAVALAAAPLWREGDAMHMLAPFRRSLASNTP